MSEVKKSKFSRADIIRIVDLKDNLGQRIDIFDMECALTVTDSKDVTGWAKIDSDNILFSESDFEDCTTEDEVKDTFIDCLTKLL